MTAMKPLSWIDVLGAALSCFLLGISFAQAFLKK